MCQENCKKNSHSKMKLSSLMVKAYLFLIRLKKFYVRFLFLTFFPFSAEVSSLSQSQPLSSIKCETLDEQDTRLK